MNEHLYRLVQILKRLGLDRDENIMNWVEIAANTDDEELRKDIEAHLDADIADALVEGDPFFPHPEEEDLNVPGTFVGYHIPTGYKFNWAFDEHEYMMLIVGSPGGGKTNLVYWLIERLTSNGKW